MPKTKEPEIRMIDSDEAWSFAIRITPHIKLMNAMNFSDLNIIAPEVNIYRDMEQFFNSKTNEIHLGTEGIINMFHVEDREELYNAFIYIHGHEEQHRRSTSGKPYRRAIERGVQAVIRYIASVEETTPRMFRSEKDYNDYIDFDLRDKGIIINMQALVSIIGTIANSLEDGRIERIRAARLPGFKNMRIVFRGKFWELLPVKYPPYAELMSNPVKHLDVLTTEILTLATCQLYSKGFVKAYAGTPIIDEVMALQPPIAKAVMSGSVRGLEPEVIHLAELLAPIIYEAIRLSEEDVEAAKELEKLLETLLKAMIDSMPENMPLDERDEDTDDGTPESTFEHSDLVVTLKDEDYDKLMEQSKKSSSNAEGIMIKREHPLEEQKEKEDESDTPGGSSGEEGDEKKPDEKSSGDESSAKNGEGKSDEDESSKSESSEKGSDSSERSSDKPSDTGDGKNDKGEEPSESTSDSSKTGESDGTSKTQEDSNKRDSDKQDTSQTVKDSGFDRGEQSSVKGKSCTRGEIQKGAAEDAKKAIEVVRNSIKEARDMAKEIAKESIGHVNEVGGHELKSMGREVLDTAPVITNKEMRDVMEGSGFNFAEFKREYQVDTDMPPVIAARGKTLHKKMEKYFRSLRTPSIRNLDSGRVDPSRIYGLAMGDTDIFRKRGKDKYFDGCAYILIDNSGSMYGEKFREACIAAAIIEEGFRGLFPIKIVAFDDDYSTVVHRVIKGWDESLHKNCSWNNYAHSNPGGGNADGCSIAVAAKELSQRREKKKLLVVLSDGSPTEGGPNPVQLTKDAIANARKKRIQVSGIYFDVGRIGPDADTFRDCYKKDYVCVPLSELDRNLEKIFVKFARS